MSCSGRRSGILISVFSESLGRTAVRFNPRGEIAPFNLRDTSTAAAGRTLPTANEEASMAARSNAPAVASALEPVTQAFIDSLAGGPPLYTLSPESARNVLTGAQKSVPVTLAPARSEDRVLNVGPKGHTNIRIYRP